MAPCFASATARFTATVLLPTPPFPAPTRMMFFTPGSIPAACGWPRTCALHESSSPFTPGTALSAASASAWIFAFSGQAGVVSSMVAKIRPPSTRTPFTIPACTRLTLSSGSITVLSAASTSFSVGIVTPNGPGVGPPGAGTLASNVIPAPAPGGFRPR